MLKGKGTRSEWIGIVTASVGWYRRRMAEVLACDVWLLVWTATCWQHACTDMQAYLYTLCPLSCTMHSGCSDGCSDHFQITKSECIGEWLHKKTYPNYLRFCITNAAELPERKKKKRKKKKKKKKRKKKREKCRKTQKNAGKHRNWGMPLSLFPQLCMICLCSEDRHLLCVLSSAVV